MGVDSKEGVEELRESVRVRTGHEKPAGKSWNSRILFSSRPAWKVIEFKCGSWKVMKRE